MINTEKRIAIIGLGYVGLPLAVEFAQKFKTIGFDINLKRINEIKNGIDNTLEVENTYLEETIKSKSFSVANNIEEISNCNIYIITVPTPTDKNNRPVLTPLILASTSVASILKKGDIVIYESTVYPGVTEDECVPILAKHSGLTYNHDFFVGYSPERINPGDKYHTVTKILKVTSGSTPEVAEIIDLLYKSIITAGTFKAKSIKVAEAAKVIENSQRDINIAFVNELSKIFNLLNINTNDVLEAASTKWNFLKYKPGLVGGHCIGVDPYYLAHKAESLGYHPQVILSGRRVNDNMGMFVANKLVKLLIAKDHVISKSNVLVLGITFKEDCPDIRNSKVIDIIKELQQFNINVDVFDPHADEHEVSEEYGITLIDKINKTYSGIILAVSHKEFLGLDLDQLKSSNSSVIFDTKAFLNRSLIDARL